MAKDMMMGKKSETKKHTRQMESKMSMSKNMPMMDMDEEMGNTKGMCKEVAGKN